MAAPLADLSSLLSWLVLAHVGAADLALVKELPNTASPDLDDPNAADEVPAPKLKLHSCAQCELPVAARFDHPEPELLRDTHLVLGEQCLAYLPQHGPVCGAASVAGTVLSLLRHHGVDEARAREAVTVRLVQDAYHALGVPNIYRSSVAVGNFTLKKCLMSLRVPGFPHAQLTVLDFGAFLETDPARRELAEWEKLKRGLREGRRYLFHSRNHYNRIFGWREVWALSKTTCAGAGESGSSSEVRAASVAHPEPEAAMPPPPPQQPAPQVHEPPAVVTVAADDLASQLWDENKAPPPPALKKRGGEDRRPLLTSRMPFGVPPVSASAPRRAAVVEPAPEPAPTPEDVCVVSQRQILMAKRGQRPQHWVPWEAVCENVRTHKINMIFEVRLVMRK